MPLSLSKTDICNGALSLVGQEAITDLDTDVSEEGDTCRIHYERSRNVLFHRHAWRFAEQTLQLTIDDVPASPLFASSFSLPDDYISWISSDLDQTAEEYFLQGRKIITNASSMFLTYTREIETVGDYSPEFIRTLEYLLASRIAYPLTKDKSLAREMFQLYELVFEQTANEDAQLSRNDRYLFDELTVVRKAFGGSGTRFGGGF